MESWLFAAIFVVVTFTVQGLPGPEIIDETYTQVVEVASVKREAGRRKYKLQAFGKEIDLDLHRTDDLLPTNLPVYVYGEDENGNPTVDDWTHRTDSGQSLYSDKRTGASLMVEVADGETKLSGMLADGILIEPVKDFDLPELVDNDFSEVKVVSRLLHRVYKVKTQQLQTDAKDYEIDGMSDSPNVVKREAIPEQLYVPVQVVVDYSLWKKLSKTEVEVIKYIKEFFNSVNLLYSTLSWPKVSVSIFGIQICKTASACKMVEKTKVDANSVDSQAVLVSIAQYAYAEKKRIGTDYALMMVMTDYDLIGIEPDGTYDRGVAGRANIARACSRYQFNQTAKVGISEDHGAFDGVKALAHEMGHLLGMLHDGDAAGSLGNPGASKCRFTDHYIMGQAGVSPNHFVWSKCSIEQLRWFSIQPTAECLHIKPKPTSYNLITKPPGKELNLDNQCKILFGSYSKVECVFPGVSGGNDKLCQGLACQVSATGCGSRGPPADGSYCGPQRYCLKGKCVCDPTAPVPTVPPKDPSCRGDNWWILLNNKTCTELLSAEDNARACQATVVEQNCCESKYKYCNPTPIKCDGKGPVTPKPTRPSEVFTLAPRTTKKPYIEPSDINCGKSCVDSPRVTINSKNCAALLATSSDKTNLCDHPLVTQHCCATRSRVCKGYHWITHSCDQTCQDNAKSSINGKKCVPFLATEADRENFCDEALTKQHCCATRWKVCGRNSIFGK